MHTDKVVLELAGLQQQYHKKEKARNRRQSDLEVENLKVFPRGTAQTSYYQRPGVAYRFLEVISHADGGGCLSPNISDVF